MMTASQLSYPSSPSTSPQLDLDVSSTQTTTTKTPLTAGESEPSARQNSLSITQDPTVPSVVVVISTHIASVEEPDSLRTMAVQDTTTPSITTILGLPATAPAAREPPLSSATEIPTSNGAPTTLITSDILPTSTPTYSTVPDSDPTAFHSSFLSLTSAVPIASPTVLGAQSPRNGTVVVYRWSFIIVLVAAFVCAVISALSLAYWYKEIRRRKRGGTFQQQTTTPGIARKKSPLKLDPETGPAAPMARAQPERPAQEERQSGSERRHFRLSVFPGWPAWMKQRVIGAGDQK